MHRIHIYRYIHLTTVEKSIVYIGERGVGYVAKWVWVRLGKWVLDTKVMRAKMKTKKNR